MNLNNISQIRYGGKDITLAKLNGDILYKRGDTPVEPNEKEYAIEYTIISRNDTDTLDYSVLPEHGRRSYRYLPLIYVRNSNSIKNYDRIEITLNDGSITDDIKTLANIVKKIKIWYPENTKAIKFIGESQYNPEINSLLNSEKINTSNFTDMSYMFYCCYRLTSLDLSNFDTSNVTDMSGMFSYCSSLTSLDLSSFDTSKVTDMYRMFYSCTSLTSLDLSNFDTSNLTNMNSMFSWNTALTSLNLSSWDISNVNDMSDMLRDCRLNMLNISNWKFGDNVSFSLDYVSVKELIMDNCDCDFFYLFRSKYSNLLDTERISARNAVLSSACTELFKDYKKLISIDLSGADISSLTSLSNFFSNCYNLKNINLSTWNTSHISDCSNMLLFVDDEVDWNYDGTNYQNWTLTEEDTGFSYLFPWNVPVISMDDYYIEYTIDNTKTYALNKSVTSGGQNYSYALPRIYTTKLDYTYTYDKIEITLKDGSITDDLSTNCNNISKIRLYYPENTVALKFYGGSLYNPIVKSVDFIKTDNFTDMSHMFYYCSTLSSALCTINWNTSKVTDMSYMFYYCTNLSNLYLNTSDTSNVTTMREMFSYTSGKVNISNFSIGFNSLYMFQNTQIRKVTARRLKSISSNLQGTFYGNSFINLIDLTDSDFSNVKSIYGMFWNCPALTTIIGHECLFHDKIESINNLFNGCYRLSLSVDLNNCTALTSAEYAFANMTVNLTMNSNFDYLQSASGMFYYTNLSGSIAIKAKNISNMSNMFNGVNLKNNIQIHDLFDNVSDASYAFANISNSGYTLNILDSRGIHVIDNFVAPNCYIFDYICYNSSIPISVCLQGSCRNAFEMCYDPKFSCLGAITDANSMFKDCGASYISNIVSLDMSQCYDMSYMFYNCYNLQELDISNWTTSSCGMTNSMFYDCTSLYYLNLKNWETYNIYDYYDMFYNVPDSCTITVGYNYFTLNESDTGFNGSFNWEY